MSSSASHFHERRPEACVTRESRLVSHAQLGPPSGSGASHHDITTQILPLSCPEVNENKLLLYSLRGNRDQQRDEAERGDADKEHDVLVVLRIGFGHLAVELRV